MISQWYIWHSWTLPRCELLLCPIHTPNLTANIRSLVFTLQYLEVVSSMNVRPYRYLSLLQSLMVDIAGQWVVPCDANETMSFSFG